MAGNCSSGAWQEGPEKRTFATFLKTAGYVNVYAGKYLNQYGKVGGAGHVPPGWDFWAGLLGNSRYAKAICENRFKSGSRKESIYARSAFRYYDYVLSINGKEESHGSNYSTDYLTDVLGRKAKSFFDLYFSLSSKPKTPFLLVLGTPAPHAPFTPAPQYETAFSGRTAPRTPAFNYVEDADHPKHWFINTSPRPLTDPMLASIDETYRNRLRTMLSVDDLVDGVMRRLEREGVLQNTFVIFTSDHGFHLGQFGLTTDKRQPYDTDLRIPLLVRGPGVSSNVVVDNVVVSIDLAPTILEMGGVTPPEEMDGTSFLPQLLPYHGNEVARVSQNQHSFLVSYHGEHDQSNVDCLTVRDVRDMAQCVLAYDCKCQDSRNNTYACVRSISDSEDTTFCQFEDDVGFREMYNLSEDTHQLYNIDSALTPESRHFYTEKLDKLKSCSGRSQCFLQ